MVTTDIENAVLDVPDLGVTLRTLLACAAKGAKTNHKRSWKIRYKMVIIGSVRIKTTLVKQEGLENEQAIVDG